MRKAVVVLTLGMMGSAFCLDEYLPIEPKKFEVDVGYAYTGITGFYDKDGTKQDVTGSPLSNSIPLQVKYGIMAGLDVSLGWTFLANNKDAGDNSGFTQPDIAVKYAMMDIGLGAFVDYTLPFATGDFADPKQPPMALSFGLLYTKTFMPKFRLTSMAGYMLNFENDNKVKSGNVFTILAKPEYIINANASVYLGLKYSMAGETELDGTSLKDSDGNSFVLYPGWNATWLPNVSTEVNVPITLMGKNSPASWGIAANVYVTLPK